MSSSLNIVVGKLVFSSEDSKSLLVSSSQNVILTIEGDNINVWYDKTNQLVRTSAVFTGTVHYRIGT